MTNTLNLTKSAITAHSEIKQVSEDCFYEIVNKFDGLFDYLVSIGQGLTPRDSILIQLHQLSRVNPDWNETRKTFAMLMPFIDHVVIFSVNFDWVFKGDVLSEIYIDEQQLDNQSNIIGTMDIASFFNYIEQFPNLNLFLKSNSAEVLTARQATKTLKNHKPNYQSYCFSVATSKLEISALDTGIAINALKELVTFKHSDCANILTDKLSWDAALTHETNSLARTHETNSLASNLISILILNKMITASEGQFTWKASELISHM